ncbi:MAG TPA: FAD-dependent oxidoreductase, partial [Candidatus Limnocylindrales bacterium]|nr:FAD-dependent oxidoreductase [Candidatus Limnocylindrales bacterium]
MPDAADVVIIGGGPAGAATAIRLALRGISAIVVDYAAEPRWRACGVFSSPLSRRHLADLGLGAATIKSLYRPISALNLESTRGVRCRIEYERGHACG